MNSTPTRVLLLSLSCLLVAACSTSQRTTVPMPKPGSPTREAPVAATPTEDQGPIVGQPGIAERPAVQSFIAEISRKHGFSAAMLTQVFEQTAIHQSILDAMAKPYEAKPWSAYRKLFLTDKRIEGGRTFLRENAVALERARAKYGVAPEIITAIIGIESSYGRKPGRYRVIDALSTLAFAYPRRATYFRDELEQFLLLCREEGLDYLEPLGSYAGAMGMPQFMPSSYRKLAADGDGDGHRDIWHNPADAIASVARYFAKNGWHSGEPIAVPARISGSSTGLANNKNPKPTRSLAQLAELGIEPEESVPGHLKGALVELPTEAGTAAWIVFHNFAVIMRYNHSVLYAMAAYELSRELEHRH